MCLRVTICYYTLKTGAESGPTSVVNGSCCRALSKKVPPNPIKMAQLLLLLHASVAWLQIDTGRPQELPQSTESVHLFGLKNLSPKDHISDISFFLTPKCRHWWPALSPETAQRWPFSIALMRLISTADLVSLLSKNRYGYPPVNISKTSVNYHFKMEHPWDHFSEHTLGFPVNPFLPAWDFLYQRRRLGDFHSHCSS